MTDKTPTSSDGTFWLDDAGIIHAVAPKGAQDTLQNAQASLAAIRQTAAGIKRPVLVDIRRIKSATIEARKFWSGEEVPKVVNAVALLINSPVSRVVGNFYLGLNRSLVPTKIFTDEIQAVDWLKPFI